ncbi:MAG: MFS transporter [Verrucomicrobiota bacterium]
MTNVSPTKPAPPSSTPGRFRWVICSLLFFSVAVNYIDRLTLGILKGPLCEKLGWTDLDYGYITAAFSFAYAFGYLFGGWAMDRMGVKRGLPLFVVIWSAAAMAHGLCDYLAVTEVFRMKYPWFSWAEKGIIVMTLTLPLTAAGFMFARILLGLSEGANFPAAIKIVAEWFPVRERALATGIFNAGTNVGAVLCPILVPWIYLHLGWQMTFYVTGGTGFLWVIGWWWIYDHPETHKHLSEAERNYIREGLPAVEEKKVKVPWIKLLGYRAVWAYVIAGILAAPAWGFYQSFLPDFLAKKFSAPKLALTDLPPPAVLTGELNRTNSEVARYLQSQLSPETRALLAGSPNAAEPQTNLTARVLEDLNRLILTPTRLDTNYFSQVALRTETLDLIGKPAKTNTIPRINRLLLEDACPPLRRMMSLQSIGWWTGAFFGLAAIGGVLGGWLAGRLLSKGWSLNAARKVAFLICALSVVPVFLAPLAGSAWLAVLIIGIAGSAHQGWSANLFSFVSDTMPKHAISSVVGLGGFVGYFTGGFVNGLTGYIVQETGSYIWVFVYFSGTYVISLLAIQLLVPRIGQSDSK